MHKTLLWVLWSFATASIAGYYLVQLNGTDKTVFLPNRTTSGHYQIEMNCAACHGETFSSTGEIQKNCERCHLEELKAAKDSHPKSKFTDPRNADTLKKLDARYCVTCHVEHQPEYTSNIGVTQPAGFCVKCHNDIEEDRPSHRGIAFTDCASAGCHNYHDNRALYEDFLIKHAGEPAHKPVAVTPKPDIDKLRIGIGPDARPLAAADIDAPSALSGNARINDNWAMSKHAETGVNCSDCHWHEATRIWQDRPDYRQCRTCHEPEVTGFLKGKHGMRLDAGLSPMRVKWARQPMHPRAGNRTPACDSCHRSHRFDVTKAAVDACESCHADRHSKNYRKSEHFRLWQNELNGSAPPRTGVSCATCHLPATRQHLDRGSAIATQHNQNSNLRPNEKMIRTVCLNCHSLAFSIDALADPALIGNNFVGRPAVHIDSIDMATARQ